MIIITEAARPYLVEQSGGLYDLKDNQQLWDQAYHSRMYALLGNILDYLPDECQSVLDVGGGMGGIDILLYRVLNGPEVAILDGDKDPPTMVRHNQPFNDLSVAEAFLKANGVRRFTPIPRHHLPEPRPFDLIVSFASWCFHYEPQTYLKWIKDCAHERTRVIVDVRTQRPGWVWQLEAAFGPSHVIHQRQKFDRRAFNV